MPRPLVLLWLFAASCAATVGARADELGDLQRLQAAGDTAAALLQVDKALAAKPRDAQLRFLRAVLLTEANRVPEALAAFRRMNEDYPELPDPLNNMAVLYAAQGQLDQARLALEAALRTDPQHRASRENLAEIHVRLAVRLWEGLVDGSAPVNEGLARKLRMARDLVRTPG